MEKWLEELNNEIFSIFHHLDLYKKLAEIIDNNKSFEKMDKTLLEWMRKSFIVDLVIGIGRICDNSRGTKSLVRFLQELKNKEEYITRKRYLKFFNNFHRDKLIDSHMFEIQNNYFDKLAGKGIDKLPKKRIDGDIAKLVKKNPCKKIIDFRNEYLAHIAKIKKPVPTHGELVAAFKVIEEIVKKYNVLIRGANSEFTPIMQGNWGEVLTIPWIENR